MTKIYKHTSKYQVLFKSTNKKLNLLRFGVNFSIIYISTKSSRFKFNYPIHFGNKTLSTFLTKLRIEDGTNCLNGLLNVSLFNDLMLYEYS